MTCSKTFLCNNSFYNQSDACILHCKKPYKRDCEDEWAKYSFDFKLALIDHLVELVIGIGAKELEIDGVVYSQSFLRDFFSRIEIIGRISGNQRSSKIKNLFVYLRKFEIVLNGIHFTQVDQKLEPFNYVPLLQVFGGIEFLKCTFIDTTYLYLPEASVVFGECTFQESHEYANYKGFSEQPELPLYKSCKFLGDVSIKRSFGHGKCIIDRDVFENCLFSKNIEISRCEFTTGQLFQGMDAKTNSIGILIDDVVFETPFILNGVESIKNISMFKTYFNEKFELKNNLIKSCYIDDCNFKKVSDFFYSKFEIFKVRKTVFSGFAAFEETIFGVEKKLQNKPAIFLYVTFESFSNFRGATFNDGLDIEKSNFAQPPNFLGSFVDLENTPRETYRIIKHSFDSVGNYIEANHFFALEMKKNKSDLKKRIQESTKLSEEERSQVKSELLVFRFNEFFSNFGQNWQRPFWLILVLAVIAQFFYCGLADVGAHNSTAVSVFCEFSEVIKDFLCNHDAGWLVLLILISSLWAWFYSRVPMIFVGLFFFGILLKIIGVSFPISTLLTPLVNLLNHVVEHIPPFNKLLVKGHEFISFVINVLFAVLIWQLVVSVKRLTRR